MGVELRRRPAVSMARDDPEGFEGDADRRF